MGAGSPVASEKGGRRAGLPDSGGKAPDAYGLTLSTNVPREDKRIESVASTIASSLRSSGVVIIASEPGLGRTAIVARVPELVREPGLHAMRLDFRGEDPDRSCRRIVKQLGDAAKRARSGQPALVTLRRLPLLDDAEVSRVAAAIRRAALVGARILVVADFENELLVEALPDAVCLRSYLLLERFDAPVTEEVRVTGGIPSLCAAYGVASGQAMVRPEHTGTFLDALGRAMTTAIRPTLTLRERRLRAAMMLLGTGSFQELLDVVPRVEGDYLAQLARDAPLFGVDAARERFRCVALADDECLLACLPRLLDDDLSCVAVGVAELLMARGSWARAASIASVLFVGSQLPEFVAQWGTELVEVGASELLRRVDGVVLGEAPALRAVRAAHSAVCEARPGLELLGLSGTTEDDLRERVSLIRAGLMCRCRMALRDARSVVVGPIPDDVSDASMRRLLAHLAAVGLLLEGKASAAFRLLLVDGTGEGGTTLSSELLRADFELARALCGDMDGGGSTDALAASRDYFARAGMRSFELVCEVVEQVILVVRDGGRGLDCDALGHRAERLGDVLTQACAMLVGSVSDLRVGYHSRARVRADSARALSRRAGCAYLAELGDLLCLVSDALMGAGEASLSLVPGEGPLCEVRAMVEEAIRMMHGEKADLGEGGVSARSERGGRHAAGRRAPTLPSDSAWVLRTLAIGMGDMSSCIVRAMPPSWRAKARVGEHDDLASGVLLERAREHSGRATISLEEGVRSGHGVEVAVLGGVSVLVNGQPIPDRRLRLRRTKSLVAFLASTRGHTASRHGLIEAIWPEDDYETGTGHVYQATSMLRREVEKVDRELDPVLANRHEGTIALNDGCVSCDVDRFRDVALLAIGLEGDDEGVLRAASAADELYKGDLYVSPTDTSGVMLARMRELRDMHADVMVAAANAALRLGRSRVAVRYADSAVLADDLREDAMEVLIRAYDACGRDPEAQMRYTAFARRLAERSGRLPSQGLRRLAEELWGKGGGAGRKRQRKKAR